MKKIILLAIFFMAQVFVSAQKNFLDQAYLSTSASVDSLVIPDKIYISITISETDSKNRKSVEELERKMETTLKRLNINTEKDLSLSNFSSDFKSYFLRGQNILKNKEYSLLVRDAVTAGRVLLELENIGISNVRIDKLEYSKKEELLLELKAKAVAKTKITAQKLIQSLGQKVGKAIMINDNNASSYYDEGLYEVQALASVKSTIEEPIPTEFKKIRLNANVEVKYILE